MEDHHSGHRVNPHGGFDRPRNDLMHGARPNRILNNQRHKSLNTKRRDGRYIAPALVLFYECSENRLCSKYVNTTDLLNDIFFSNILGCIELFLYLCEKIVGN